ncbi:MAG TPA: hypothetical protein VF170_16040 [Planctomycetaceae bacterium]
MLELAPRPAPKAVRPAITAEPAEGGVRLSPSTGRAALFVVPIVGAVFAVPLAGVAGAALGPVAASAAAGTVGLGVAAFLGHRFLLHRGLHPPELLLDRGPVRPEVSVRARFRQRLKRPLYVRELVPTVRCVETARYRVGTDTRTVTNVSFEENLAPVSVEASEQDLAAEWDFELPAGVLPSFTAPDNRVEWTFAVRVVIDGYPDAKPEFPLLVLPGRSASPVEDFSGEEGER